MKKGFVLIMPFIAVLCLFCVQSVATGSVLTRKVPIVAFDPPVNIPQQADVAIDTVLDEAEFVKVKDSYKYVAKGGLEKAQKKGDNVISEMDAYLIKLDKEIAAKKRLIGQKEAELKELSMATAVPVKKAKKKQPSEEPNDDY